MGGGGTEHPAGQQPRSKSLIPSVVTCRTVRLGDSPWPAQSLPGTQGCCCLGFWNIYLSLCGRGWHHENMRKVGRCWVTAAASKASPWLPLLSEAPKTWRPCWIFFGPHARVLSPRSLLLPCQGHHRFTIQCHVVLPGTEVEGHGGKPRDAVNAVKPRDAGVAPPESSLAQGSPEYCTSWHVPSTPAALWVMMRWPGKL